MGGGRRADFADFGKRARRSRSCIRDERLLRKRGRRKLSQKLEAGDFRGESGEQRMSDNSYRAVPVESGNEDGRGA